MHTVVLKTQIINITITNHIFKKNLRYYVDKHCLLHFVGAATSSLAHLNEF